MYGWLSCASAIARGGKVSPRYGRWLVTAATRPERAISLPTKAIYPLAVPSSNSSCSYRLTPAKMAPPTTCPVARGEYAPTPTSASRGPCPLVNSLANHGYLPRDGREVRHAEFKAAMNEIGLSAALGAVFCGPIYLEHKDPKAPSQPRSFWGHLWYNVRNPWAIILSQFAMRHPGQKDSMGVKCLNLEQLGLPGAVEHDISLSRKDIGQGDNITLQPKFVEELLSYSSDGKTLTAEDFAAHRRTRIAQQKRANPTVNYGAPQHQVACGEVALILDVFGNGKEIPCDYVRALFLEERLPVKEGWTKRRWWSLGFWELGRTAMWFKGLVGVQV